MGDIIEVKVRKVSLSQAVGNLNERLMSLDTVFGPLAGNWQVPVRSCNGQNFRRRDPEH